MTHENDSTVLEPVLQLLVQHGFDGAAEALETLLNAAMRLERALALKAEPYARISERQGYANGFKPKTVRTRLGELDLLIPQVRDGIPFYPSALERGVRSERALKLAIAEMYVQGVSTLKMGQVLEQLCGTGITSTQVSRAAQALDGELEKWRSRPLGSVQYLLLDARYEKVRVAGAVRSCAVLIAAGVDAAGKRTILGVSVSLSEAEVHWREFFASLQRRGLCGVTLAVSDDHAGLKAALTAAMPSVPRQRCQVHLQQNAQQFASSRALNQIAAGCEGHGRESPGGGAGADLRHRERQSRIWRRRARRPWACFTPASAPPTIWSWAGKSLACGRLKSWLAVLTPRCLNCLPRSDDRFCADVLLDSVIGGQRSSAAKLGNAPCTRWSVGKICSLDSW